MNIPYNPTLKALTILAGSIFPNSTPKYLFFYEKGADAKEAFKTALGSESITDNGQTVTVDDVTFGCSTNTTQLTIKNTYNQLTVQKYWLSAADGKPLANADIPAKSIQVQLYRYTAVSYTHLTLPTIA